MNFFFSLKSRYFRSDLIVPKFKNRKPISKNLLLFKAQIKNKLWQIKKVNCVNNKNFFFLKDRVINSNDIYFLAFKSELSILNKEFKELQNFSTFTNSSPAFRSNLKIYLPKGGVSSYQSEYPFDMTKKNGSIASPISLLSQKIADKNFIFFKNIFYKPIIVNFYGYLIDYTKKIVLKKFLLKSNTTNIINIENKYIYSDVYFFTDNFLGIPIYVNKLREHLSLEHTHPPHEYVLSSDKFNRVNLLKHKFYEIIKQNKIK
jgi:hypothetical protein